MAQTVILPKLGQATEESTIVKWHKKEGDLIKKGDVLFEMETDKAVLEAESFYDGTLLKVLVPEGVTVPVNTVVGYIGDKGEKVPDAPPPPPPVAAAAPAPVPAAAAAAQPAATPVVSRPVSGPAPAPTAAKPAAAAPVAKAEVFISPRAKALAKAKVIHYTPIRGSGPQGRIVEKDVVEYLASKGYDQLLVSPSARQLASRENVDLLSVKGSGQAGRIMIHDIERALRERPQTMSKMRQVIARRLTESFTGTPHFFVTLSVDMTNLMGLRKELKQKGLGYSVTDFILEAVILSIQEYPAFNSVTDGTTVRWHGSIDLGMAVSLKEGLVVPVIRNAGELSLAELHEASKNLAQKARDGKLLPDEMTGSTFTVSNMGMLNVEEFTAIINPGEAAILAVASTVDTPVVREGQIKIRSMMKLTLSSDHRVIDGSQAAKFLNAIKTKLEDVELWKSLM
jgi:pyruvate dehydrogenase E2 component (dihydrolipoamide acetyltransferase)